MSNVINDEKSKKPSKSLQAAIYEMSDPKKRNKLKVYTGAEAMRRGLEGSKEKRMSKR
jgi:hypothetical protein